MTNTARVFMTPVLGHVARIVNHAGRSIVSDVPPAPDHAIHHAEAQSVN